MPSKMRTRCQLFRYHVSQIKNCCCFWRHPTVLLSQWQWYMRMLISYQTSFLFFIEKLSLMIFQHQQGREKVGNRRIYHGKAATCFFLINFLLNFLIVIILTVFFFSLDKYFSPPFRRGSSRCSCKIGDSWLKMYSDIARYIRVEWPSQIMKLSIQPSFHFIILFFLSKIKSRISFTYPTLSLLLLFHQVA